MKQYRKSFIKIFQETARYHHRYQVFRDFVTMAAISMHNGFYKLDALESEYLEIAKRYEKSDIDRFCQLFAQVIMGLETPCDFLGSVFMELELGNDRSGQFFTPYEIAKLMALLTHGDSIEELSEQPFVTLQEPACGAGGMIIAFADVMLSKGINPQQKLWVQAIDVDPVPAMMCYLQLALLHIPAEIVIGNSLTLQFTRILRTPAHYMGFWDSKLSSRSKKVVESKLVAEVSTPVVELVSRTPEVKRLQVEQLALFDFVG